VTMGGNSLTVLRSSSVSITLPMFLNLTSFMYKPDIQSYQMTAPLYKTILFFLSTNVFHDEYKRVLYVVNSCLCLKSTPKFPLASFNWIHFISYLFSADVNYGKLIFMVTSCINDIRHFIIQLTHTT